MTRYEGVPQHAPYGIFPVKDVVVASGISVERVERPSMVNASAKFAIGQVVQHRIHPFRGVIFDVDPVFSNTEEWWNAIPEDSRPRKDQPFYHLFAENETSYYVAYVSEQNLLPDETGEPVDHPEVEEMFSVLEDGQYAIEATFRH